MLCLLLSREALRAGHSDARLCRGSAGGLAASACLQVEVGARRLGPSVCHRGRVPLLTLIWTRETCTCVNFHILFPGPYSPQVRMEPAGPGAQAPHRLPPTGPPPPQGRTGSGDARGRICVNRTRGPGAVWKGFTCCPRKLRKPGVRVGRALDDSLHPGLRLCSLLGAPDPLRDTCMGGWDPGVAPGTLTFGELAPGQTHAPGLPLPGCPCRPRGF